MTPYRTALALALLLACGPSREERCANAPELPMDGIGITVDTSKSPDSFRPRCGSGQGRGGDEVYRFTLAERSAVRLRGPARAIAVYGERCGEPPLACQEHRESTFAEDIPPDVRVVLEPGSYRAVVDGNPSGSLELTALSVTELCRSAPVLPLDGTSVEGTTTGAPNAFADVCSERDGTDNPDRIHRFTLAETAKVTLSVRPTSDWYPHLFVYAADCTAPKLSCGISVNRFPLVNQYPAFSIALDAGTYVAVVDTDRGSGGYRLTATLSLDGGQ